jgi:vitamin K-dependent gamma-carboxylase-like protein
VPASPDGWFARGFSRWAALWDEREAPTSLWLCRVLVSSVVLVDLLDAALSGATAAAFAPPPDGLGYAASGQWSAHVFGATTATAQGLYWTAVIAAVCFLFGVATRASGLVLTLALAQLAGFAPEGDRGVDMLLRIAILILICSASHARWTFDAWLGKRLGRAAPTLVPAWPRRLLMLQLVWLYFSAAHNRGDAAWWPTGGFSALATLLCDPHYARFPPDWLQHVYPLTQVATATTMSFELGSPLLLLLTRFDRTPLSGGRVGELVRRYRIRWLWLGLGVMLHLGIALTMRLGIFSFGVLALYPVLIHPTEWRAVAASFRRAPPVTTL